MRDGNIEAACIWKYTSREWKTYEIFGSGKFKLRTVELKSRSAGVKFGVGKRKLWRHGVGAVVRTDRFAPVGLATLESTPRVAL